jgi:hypothetical protein
LTCTWARTSGHPRGMAQLGMPAVRGVVACWGRRSWVPRTCASACWMCSRRPSPRCRSAPTRRGRRWRRCAPPLHACVWAAQLFNCVLAQQLHTVYRPTRTRRVVLRGDLPPVVVCCGAAWQAALQLSELDACIQEGRISKESLGVERQDVVRRKGLLRRDAVTVEALLQELLLDCAQPTPPAVSVSCRRQAFPEGSARAPPFQRWHGENGMCAWSARSLRLCAPLLTRRPKPTARQSAGERLHALCALKLPSCRLSLSLRILARQLCVCGCARVGACVRGLMMWWRARRRLPGALRQGGVGRVGDALPPGVCGGLQPAHAGEVFGAGGVSRLAWGVCGRWVSIGVVSGGSKRPV